MSIFKHEPTNIKEQDQGVEYLWDTPLIHVYAFVPYGQDDPTSVNLFLKSKHELIMTVNQVDAIIDILKESQG